MGDDPTKFEWIEGERNGTSGADLIQLVQQGRLWLNLRNVLKFHPQIHGAVNAMYEELESKSPGFKAQDRSANLLVSSSTAMVHYHVDMPVNMLWHIRGKKRVWVYPHFDFRFVSQPVIEKVCAGELSEDVPFDPEFDKFALTFDVEPGQLLTWPQLTPHRVQNLGGMCVSLSTEHKNPRARRRINVHEANYVLRTTFGKFFQSADPDGVYAHLKQTFNRSVRLGKKLFGKKKEQFVYSKNFLVDPSSENGIVMLDVEQVIPELLAV
ncbi:MAG: cupin-like domain-containing protein [Planctomycetota bacterium]